MKRTLFVRADVCVLRSELTLEEPSTELRAELQDDP